VFPRKINLASGALSSRRPNVRRSAVVTAMGICIGACEPGEPGLVEMAGVFSKN
jgi:hypothetical protein